MNYMTPAKAFRIAVALERQFGTADAKERVIGQIRALLDAPADKVDTTRLAELSAILNRIGDAVCP